MKPKQLKLNRKQRRQLKNLPPPPGPIGKASEMGMTPEEMAKYITRGEVVKISGGGFRPNTEYKEITSNFMMVKGGLGDYICQMPVFEWMANELPQVIGNIYVAKPFSDVARYIMKPYPKWKVIDDDKSLVPSGQLIYDPSSYNMYINAIGAHLMDLGAMMYAALDKVPKKWERMPDLASYDSGKDWGLTSPYAVLTPTYTAPARMMPGAALNTLSRYLLDKGITPVYLGKRDFAPHATADYKGKEDEEFDAALGVDLREQTTLLEAVEVMKGARLVLGVDNGLLHFAGCTEVPIIFGYTVTTVAHRHIKRNKGKTINITVNEELLPCIACQSKARFIPDHNFKRCLYGDYACIKALFYDNAAIWKNAIDNILEDKSEF